MSAIIFGNNRQYRPRHAYSLKYRLKLAVARSVAEERLWLNIPVLEHTQSRLKIYIRWNQKLIYSLQEDIRSFCSFWLLQRFALKDDNNKTTTNHIQFAFETNKMFHI